MRQAVLWLRDYFVYKDMFNPDAAERARLMGLGRPGQDAFLLLALHLEQRARALGRLPDDGYTPPPDAGGGGGTSWRRRNAKLLGAYGGRASRRGYGRGDGSPPPRARAASADSTLRKLDAIRPVLIQTTELSMWRCAGV